jgi:hypothetical protein
MFRLGHKREQSADHPTLNGARQIEMSGLRPYKEVSTGRSIFHEELNRIVVAIKELNVGHHAPHDRLEYE